MKHLKIALLALLLIVSYSNANAQDKENPWMLNAGTNLIDIKDGKSGNIVPWLSKISLSRYIGSGFSLELAGSVNKIEKPWSVGSEATFGALDLNVKYDLNPNATGWFDPYLFAGLGENWVGSKNGLGLNVGLGINAWINKSFGITYFIFNNYKMSKGKKKVEVNLIKVRDRATKEILIIDANKEQDFKEKYLHISGNRFTD